MNLPALVLSATPLPANRRREIDELIGRPCEFVDLATGRQNGLAGMFRQIRSRRYEEVIVAADGEAFFFAAEPLRVTAILVKARSRSLLIGRERSPISASQLLPALIRIGVGILRGLISMVVNWINAARIRSPRRLRIAGAVRCLYLRPTLMIGTAVGGSVGHVAGVVNAMLRRGMEVTLLALGPQPMVDEKARQELVPPRFVAGYPPELNGHRFHRLFVKAAMREARRLRPDFIYQRYALNDLSGVLLRKHLSIPLILEFNGSEVWLQRNWGRPLSFERASSRVENANLHGADLVVVVSEPTYDQVRSVGVPAERILFYPNAVDLAIFNPDRFTMADRLATRAELGIAPDADVFTFVGTFGKWHGTDVLARAIRDVIDSDSRMLRERRIHFLFIGDGQRAPEARDILGEHAAGPFVTMAGLRPQGDTPRLLAASDILLSPHAPNEDGSPFFGSPTKLFEYMAIKRPIIASDLDQIGQILRGWEPGQPLKSAAEPAAAIMVKPGSVDELAGAIRRVAVMPEAARSAMAIDAFRYVQRSFTWDANLNAVLAAFARGLESSDALASPLAGASRA